MKLIKTIAIILVICAVFGAAMFGLNFLTGPIIEQNNAGAELAPLLAVMPEGSTFGGDALIYTPDAPGSFTGVSAEVLKIYKEANGLGYAIQCQTVGNYEATPMTLTFGVSADGKICGIQVDNYTDSIDVREKDPNFLTSFVGKDSALADVNLVAGCTFSSSSIKNAVSAGLGALIANNMIAEGVKSNAQILAEMIPTVFPGMGGTEDLGAIDGTNITKAYKSTSGIGFAYVIEEGEKAVLAVVNAAGKVTVYDLEGKDVTASEADAVAAATKHFDANKTDYSTAANAEFAKAVEGAGDMTALSLDSYNTIVYAASFEAGENTYYGFYSRVYGFEQMEIFIVLDAEGKIVKLSAKEFIFHKEYFGTLDPNYNESNYVAGFIGMTGETFTGDNAMIGGATMTSNAVKTATKDAFEAFAALTKGGEQ